jgi:methylamine dehydrogenase light chain
MNLIAILLKKLDHSMRELARHSARTRGRRSFLAKLGATLAGGALLPMLPFDRAETAESALSQGSVPSQGSDPSTCEYWAYCSLNGTRCNACGGTLSQCPPGSQPSKVSWVGTCLNPTDKKNYLVSYSDCCGKPACGEAALCQRHEGDLPAYRVGASNEMNWCMANTNKGVNCSTALVIGVADSD